MVKLKEMTAAGACKRMDALAREYLDLDKFDRRRAQIRARIARAGGLGRSERRGGKAD
jgi:hypothetical protein